MKNNFYDKYSNKNNINNYNSGNYNPYIRSDFYLIFSLLKELVVFILLFIPYLFLAIFFMFSGNKFKSNEYFSKIFHEPFKLISEIKHWFFQARYTAFLIMFLFFMFAIQFLLLGPYMNNLMVHPKHIFEGNYYSVITSIFFHADIVHLLSNSLALLIFGRIVEKQFGAKMLGIFLASGIIANIVSNIISIAFDDLFFSLGASGAIAGLIIFAIMIEPFAFTSVFLIPLPIFIVGWGLIALDIIGLTNPSNVNNFAHLGGYSALLIIFFFLEYRHRDKIITGFVINLALLVLFYFIWKFSGITLSEINLFKK